MTRDELFALENQLSELLAEKRRVGEFDASAGAIITLVGAIRDIAKHLQAPIDTVAINKRMERHLRGRK